MSTTSSSMLWIGQPALLDRFIADLAQQAEQGDNRRHAPRYPVEGRLTVGVVLGDAGTYRPLHRAWLTDLSCLGLGMLLENPLETGLRLYVNFETMLQTPCLVPLQVVYCRPLLPHTYRIGGCFLWEQSDDGLPAPPDSA